MCLTIALMLIMACRLILVRTDMLMHEVSLDIKNGASSHHNKTTAIIHMGPHKTGTSTVQAMTAMFMGQLQQDGYQYPVQRAQDYINSGWNINQVHFAKCFYPQYETNNPELHDPCEPESLFAGMEIAAEGKSMLASSEFFSKLQDHGLKTLGTYLTTTFDEVIIVVFYRRYFEWFVSLYNEFWKMRKFGKQDEFKWETSIVDFIQMIVIEENFFYRDVASDILVMKEMKHTYFLVDMLKKHFETVEVVNMHDGKDSNEEFFCEVMPHANRTCKSVKDMTKDVKANPSKDLIWGDMAYKAMKQGMVQIENHEEMSEVMKAVQKHQLETLGLTKNDFPLTCPSSEVLDQMLSVSLMMEESLFPKFYKTPHGEESLRASFKKYSKTKLCTLNADEALRDTVWIDFFKNFSY